MALKDTQCICGSGTHRQWAVVNNIPIVECSCGIRRVQSVDPDKYTAMYVSGSYHSSGSPDLPHAPGTENHREPHKERFTTDYEVGLNRLERLLPYKTAGSLLDVGCANGAFMAAAQSKGFQVCGVDMSDAAVSDSVLKKAVRIGDLRRVGFQRRTIDVITFNDSFEHFIDPLSALKASHGILKRDGILVVEIPDMGCADAVEQGPSFKHVKPHEHLWYFNAAQLRRLLEDNGFFVVGMDVPIPGKVTVYASPAVTVEAVEVLGPPGVGDILWTLNKLKGIRDRESPCRIKYVVCAAGDPKIATRSKDFLGMCTLIDSYEFRPVPLPMDSGCPDPAVPIYELLPNDYLDPKVPPLIGGFIENWHPELPSDWDAGLVVPECALSQARLRLKGKKAVGVYMSSHVWNRIVADPVWTVRHWAELFIKLSDAGLTPVILGAGWDGAYAADVATELVQMGRNPASAWINSVGKTALPLAMAYMQLAVGTVGIANGLPMLSLYLGRPTAILWPVRGISDVQVTFCKEFKTNWAPPYLRDSGLYTAFTVGQFTVDDLFNEILRISDTKTLKVGACENTTEYVGR